MYVHIYIYIEADMCVIICMRTHMHIYGEKDTVLMHVFVDLLVHLCYLCFYFCIQIYIYIYREREEYRCTYIYI